jgi:hypothetical protein
MIALVPSISLLNNCPDAQPLALNTSGQQSNTANQGKVLTVVIFSM